MPASPSLNTLRCDVMKIRTANVLRPGNPSGSNKSVDDNGGSVARLLVARSTPADFDCKLADHAEWMETGTTVGYTRPNSTSTLLPPSLGYWIYLGPIDGNGVKWKLRPHVTGAGGGRARQHALRRTTAKLLTYPCDPVQMTPSWWKKGSERCLAHPRVV